MNPLLKILVAPFAAAILLGSAHADYTRLVLTGSSTIAPLALEMGKRFEARNPGVRVDVQTGGSSRGVADATNGLADIGMVSRALNPVEASTLVAHPIAMDGVGIIIHAGNPVATLSDEQIRAIYTGQRRNWREVGGPDRPITVVNKAEGHSTLELFLHYTNLRNSDIRAQAVIGDNEQGIKTVAGNPGAIGYVSIGTAEYDIRHGTPIKLLPLKGVAATTDAVRRGRFPLSRPLNLVTRGKPSPLAQRFIDFAQSAAVNDLIEAQSFVSPER
ncbi:phosphate ABC transporter substrate-binding protein [Thiobacillus sp.]|uniref:phosphate ABC transporter substrate-binding protein n=1 Tax=Thiobacillus sp. TaxID=924 RepID=UPI0011DAE5B2|nr:phosphate ABC transporter substrate-binding protein [Thiobacillus sp.]TXH74000.1 MAG: phosphate ABC transporter substrate-binding protein [Thiobacillus sp.]